MKTQAVSIGVWPMPNGQDSFVATLFRIGRGPDDREHWYLCGRLAAVFAEYCSCYVFASAYASVHNMRFFLALKPGDTVGEEGHTIYDDLLHTDRCEVIDRTFEDNFHNN